MFHWITDFLTTATQRVFGETVSVPTIKSTWKFIEDLHAHQMDTATNTPYYTHPMRVMDIVKQLLPDASDEVIMAAQMHDGVEDGRITDPIIGARRHFTFADMEEMLFPAETIRIVRAVTKPPKVGEDKRTQDQKLADNK